MKKQEFKKIDEIIEETRKRLLNSASDVRSVVNFCVDTIKQELHDRLEED